MGHAEVDVRRVKREEFRVICTEVVVQVKGGDKSTERNGVHDEE